jgi:glycosyltransferase involved in cell wall biosynthesis
MRVLFVSGSPAAGSLQSTSELAVRLERRGHAVAILQSARGGRLRRYLHKRAVNLAVKLEGRPGEHLVAAGGRAIARRARLLDPGPPVSRWEALLPENALGTVIRRFAPQIVIASSIDRMAWRQIRSDLAAAGIASGLYLREETALGHFTVSAAPADVHLANADAHTDELRALGFDCVTVPSVVELDRCIVESTRERVLFVNPIDIYGVDIAIGLAEARPAVAFAFAESWRLDDDQRAGLLARLRALPNVELRARVDDPSQVYRDARILLVPYQHNNRPRVVLEAQVNGIPVLARDVPALREAVGVGGVLVADDAPIEQWARALDQMLEPERYAELEQLARVHSARADVDPEQIVTRFEQAVSAFVENAPTS